MIIQRNQAPPGKFFRDSQIHQEKYQKPSGKIIRDSYRQG
jgi:hypothetical protein